MESGAAFTAAINSPGLLQMVSAGGQPPKLDDAAKEFEALFMGLMVKELRNGLGENSLFGGDSSDVYGGLFDMLLSQSLAASQPLGIARLLQAGWQASAAERLRESADPETAPVPPVDLDA